MTEGTTGPLRVVIAAGTVEQRDFVLPYRVQIENGAPNAVRCVIVFHVLGSTPDQPPVELVVAPGEIGEIELRIPLGTAPKRLAVLVRGERIAYNSEVTVPAIDAAPPPARPALRGAVTMLPIALPPLEPDANVPALVGEAAPPAPPRTPPWFEAGAVRDAIAPVPRTLLFGIIAGVCTGVTLLAGFALTRPAVAQLAPPSPVAAGTNVDVPYRLSGAGTATYRVVDAAGTIDSGTLRSRDGSVRFVLPEHVHGRTLHIIVEIAGPFGSAQRSAAFDVLAAPVAAPQAPRIAMLAVDRATVNPGDTVNVTYRVDPPHGDVALIDAFGDALATAPLNASGHAMLQLPAGTAGRELAIVVRARSASGVAESRIPLVVGPAPSATASTPALDPHAGPIAGSAGLDVSDRRVASGDRIVVRIETNYDALRLELFDRAHRSVAAIDLGPGLHEAGLIAPHVTVPTDYTLEATEGQGTAQATSIFPVTVVPGSARTP